ncbi:hypothetical protein Lalb_Chr13g0296511 [Lupinus albus]|uniref:Uncharacterized protein n=1 Tax=Lupinus albus TaxID=3870 RepID=A0A6A4PIK6_LUPAL|nr:hypothetical protein Lalb_Chr13g0296511 [Lupinus albus]
MRVHVRLFFIFESKIYSFQQHRYLGKDLEGDEDDSKNTSHINFLNHIIGFLSTFSDSEGTNISIFYEYAMMLLTCPKKSVFITLH